MKNTLDYRQFSDSLRLAGATAVISAVKAGESCKSVAEKFGTTLMTIHRWVKKAEGDTIAFKVKGRPTDAPKGNHRKPPVVNYRLLPKALVDVAKASAVAKVKAGEELTKVAEDFGISKLTLTKWVG